MELIWSVLPRRRKGGRPRGQNSEAAPCTRQRLRHQFKQQTPTNKQPDTNQSRQIGRQGHETSRRGQMSKLYIPRFCHRGREFSRARGLIRSASIQWWPKLTGHCFFSLLPAKHGHDAIHVSAYQCASDAQCSSAMINIEAQLLCEKRGTMCEVGSQRRCKMILTCHAGARQAVGSRSRDP